MDPEIREEAEAQEKKAKKAKKAKAAKKAAGEESAEPVKKAVKLPGSERANITVFKDAGIKSIDVVAIDKEDRLILKDRNKTVVITRIPGDNALEVSATQAATSSFENEDGSFYSHTVATDTQRFYYDSEKSYQKHMKLILDDVKILTSPETQYSIDDKPAMWSKIETKVLKK